MQPQFLLKEREELRLQLKPQGVKDLQQFNEEKLIHKQRCSRQSGQPKANPKQ
jgi:hypothetical protein